MKPTTRQKMAKPIPTTKPTRKPKNNTKHQRGDKNGLKLTGPAYHLDFRSIQVAYAGQIIKKLFTTTN
jgi:hypothetical protein